eukprot:TRINITY_DN547_c0_g2_i8.p1 TRINITY_DN547_c0_g2~~TRINITY_DN547_c0_g2_i8.p1  ORF type:complete len:160 (+),score=74.28 TRINITY_DN547_c0_g2_i8:63-482(+)
MGKEGTISIRTKKFMYNALLGRKQFVVDVVQQSDRRGTIPKKDIQSKIAEMYKVKDDNCVSVFGFKNSFGGGRITGFGLIYDSLAQVKKTEPKHRLLRLGLTSKKSSNRKQLKEKKNRLKKVRGLAKIRGPRKKKSEKK